MPFLVITGMLWLCALAMANFARRDIYFGLVASVGLLVGTIYLCGVFNILSFGVWVARILVVAGALYCGYRLFIKHNFEWKDAILPLLLFAVGSAVIWWICRGRLFNDWDEFSHWGLSLKFLFNDKMLYSVASSPTSFKSYPPAYTLGQFILVKTAFYSFREDLLMYAGGLLSWVFLWYPLKWISFKRQPLLAVCSAVLLFFAPCMVVSHAYYRVSPDMLLGILVGFLLCVLIFEEDKTSRGILFCLGLFLLTLSKSSGAGLAILCAFIAFFYLRRVEKQRMSLSLLAPFAVVLVSKISWNRYLQVVGATERWPMPKLGELFQPLDYQKTVMTKYFKAFFLEGNYGVLVKFAPVGWLVILLVLMIVCYKFAPASNRQKCVYACGSAASVFIFFSLFMLVSYLYLFKEIEAVVLSSFYRYMATPICAMLYVTIAVIGICLTETSLRKQLLILPVMVVLYLSSGLLGNYMQEIVQAPTNAAQTQHDRYLSQRTAKYIAALGEQHPRLYLITANDAGKMQNMINYELYPITLPVQQTILACDPSGTEPWVQKYSPEEWEAVLAKEYDYVYIYCPEDQFVRDYISLFEDESQVVVDRMFQVIRTDDSHMRLRRILVSDQTE